MGRRCGYLALMSGIATGAELVYLNEDGITLDQLAVDSARMVESFRAGRKLYLVIRNERASENYTREVLARIFSEEGLGLYVQQPNAELAERAKDIISDGHEKAASDFTRDVRNGLYSDQLVAVGMQLLHDASERGDQAAAVHQKPIPLQ